VPRTRLPVDELLTVIAETPRRIAGATVGVPEAALHAAPAGEWSANDVLAHLRACADVWGDNIARIVAEDKPTIRAVNPRTWIKSTDYSERKFRPSLRAYAKQRTALLAVLQALAPRDWSRTAIVLGGGSPLELTVMDYAQRLARHDRPHVKQIARVVQAMQR
jgi:DinB superfamily